MEHREFCAHHGRMIIRSVAVVSFTASILAGQDWARHPAYTIAFGSFAPVRQTVFIAGAHGENAKPLLREPGVDYNASFSRDGAGSSSRPNGAAPRTSGACIRMAPDSSVS